MWWRWLWTKLQELLVFISFFFYFWSVVFDILKCHKKQCSKNEQEKCECILYGMKIECHSFECFGCGELAHCLSKQFVLKCIKNNFFPFIYALVSRGFIVWWGKKCIEHETPLIQLRLNWCISCSFTWGLLHHFKFTNFFYEIF